MVTTFTMLARAMKPRRRKGKRKGPRPACRRGPWDCSRSGDGLSSREVLSPAGRLTSVFGMGTGVSAGRSSPQ